MTMRSSSPADRPTTSRRKQPGAPNKAFVRIAGITLVERVIAALRSAPSVGAHRRRRTRSRRTNTPALLGAHERRADGVRITESLRNGLAGLPPDDDGSRRGVRPAGAYRRIH